MWKWKRKIWFQKPQHQFLLSIFLLSFQTTLCHIINACNFHLTYATLNQMKTNKIVQIKKNYKLFRNFRLYESSSRLEHWKRAKTWQKHMMMWTREWNEQACDVRRNRLRSVFVNYLSGIVFDLSGQKFMRKFISSFSSFFRNNVRFVWNSVWRWK